MGGGCLEMDQDTEEKCVRGEMDEYVDTEEPKLCETVGGGLSK